MLLTKEELERGPKSRNFRPLLRKGTNLLAPPLSPPRKSIQEPPRFSYLLVPLDFFLLDDVNGAILNPALSSSNLDLVPPSVAPMHQHPAYNIGRRLFLKGAELLLLRHCIGSLLLVLLRGARISRSIGKGVAFLSSSTIYEEIMKDKSDKLKKL